MLYFIDYCPSFLQLVYLVETIIRRERESERERQSWRERERETDTERERERETERERARARSRHNKIIQTTTTGADPQYI